MKNAVLLAVLVLAFGNSGWACDEHAGAGDSISNSQAHGEGHKCGDCNCKHKKVKADKSAKAACENGALGANCGTPPAPSPVTR